MSKFAILIFIFLFIFSTSIFAQNDAELRIQAGFPGQSMITSVHLSKDKTLLAGGSSTGNIVLWDAKSRREIVNYQAHTVSVTAILISDDNQYLFSGGNDRVISIYNIKTAERTQISDENGITYLKFIPEKYELISGGYEMVLKHWDIKTLAKIKEIGMDDKFNTPEFKGFPYFYSPDNQKLIWRDVQNKLLKICDLSGKILSEIPEVELISTQRTFSPDGKFLALPGTNQVIVIDMLTLKKVKAFPTFNAFFTSGIKFTKDNKQLVVTSLMNQCLIFDFETGKVLHDFKGNISIASLDYDSNTDHLYFGGYNLVEIFNKKGKKLSQFQGFAVAVNSLAIEKNQNDLFLICADASIRAFDLSLGKSAKFKIQPKTNRLACSVINSSRTRFAIAGFDSTYSVWDFATKKLVGTQKRLDQSLFFIDLPNKDGNAIINGSKLNLEIVNAETAVASLKLVEKYNSYPPITVYSKDNTKIYANDNMKISQFDLSGIKLLSIETSIPSKPSFNTSFYEDEKESKLYVGGWGGKLASFSTVDGSLKEEFEPWDKSLNKVTSILKDDKKNYLIYGYSIGEIRVRDINTKKLVFNLKGHNNLIKGFEISEDQKWLISHSLDNSTKIWDYTNGKLIVTIVILDNKEDYLMFTPDGYYYTTPKGTDAVHFLRNGKIYFFDQFDLQYNRPDIVLERIGKTPYELIQSFKRAYEKRLKKMGFNSTNFDNNRDFNVPVVQLLTDKNSISETTTPLYSVNFKASDPLYTLDRYNIFVNGVPHFGTLGKSIKAESVKSKDIKENITLNEGKNVIEILAMNSKGTESLKERVEIELTTKAKKNLYLITIGVSEFANNKYNLKYASKDAKDIDAFLSKSKGFENIYKFHLENQSASTEEIMKIKEELKKSKVDDVVLLFFSSHGVLDKNLDYYLATNNLNFADPTQNGLSYEKLESLFDGIPARQKTMFIDACHSGELDKEEIEVTTKSTEVQGDIQFRDVSDNSINYKHVGLKNSFELMKMLFSDLRRNSGTVVISAAGGAEYALESSEWNNGVFTFSLLSGLKNMDADLNKDGKVYISELQKYLNQKVQDLTQGKQTPTTRADNYLNDFVIWEK